MKLRFFLSVSLCVALAAPFPSMADVRVASWNVLHLGFDNGKRFDHLAHVIGRFDLVGLQEVMDEKAVHRLVRTLESLTQDDWQSSVSHPVGRSTYKEAYAFVWRTKTIRSAGGEAVYLDPGDKFAREPYSAIFTDRATGRSFVLAIIHIIYGDGRSDRTPEIAALDSYWSWLHDSFDAPVIVAGDFNTPPGDPAWEAFRSDAYPLITRGATTLSPVDGRYVSLYDNLWVKKNTLDITSSGIAPFPRWLDVTHAYAREHVSDHAPVYLAIGDIEINQESKNPGGQHALARSRTRPCVDINRAEPHELDKLEHIGPAMAEKIIEGRPWESLSTLSRISGISSAYVEDIRASQMACDL